MSITAEDVKKLIAEHLRGNSVSLSDYKVGRLPAEDCRTVLVDNDRYRVYATIGGGTSYVCPKVDGFVGKPIAEYVKVGALYNVDSLNYVGKFVDKVGKRQGTISRLTQETLPDGTVRDLSEEGFADILFDVVVMNHREYVKMFDDVRRISEIPLSTEVSGE